MDNYNTLFPEFPQLLYGGDYNPEQWKDTPEIWDRDMQLMKEAHINTVSIGIFAWAEIEPQENVFDFSVLDTIMDKAHKNGIKVFLATPSGARPHWLAEKYPEVLRVNEHGQREHFRARHNHCSSSAAYRERVRIIDEKLAERYHNHPALLGWHLSNEYGSGLYDGFCYCDKCAEKFRQWLKNKYGSIEELNKSWWTDFHSHKFTSFEQIEPPYLKIGDQTLYGLRLDWKRFSSDNILDFMKEEIKAIRKFSNKSVTTNCMMLYPGLNYKKFANELDFFSQDMYPEWYKGTRKTAQNLGLVSDYSRCIKGGQPFIVMESALGAAMSGLNFRKLKSTKQQTLEAVKMLACGADSIMYFQWRKGRGGSEKFHGAIVDHYDGNDTRIFKTAVSSGEMLEKISSIAGSRVSADVAITYDTENWWALGKLPPAKHDNGYMDTLQAYYNAFNDRNIPTDIIDYDDDFSKYKVIVLTSAYLMSQNLADKIKSYVENGGTVIATYLTAVADENDRCILGGVPGLGLLDVFGLRVEEVDTYRSSTGIVCKNSIDYNGSLYDLNGIAEIIVPSSAKALAYYTDDFYASSGAAFVNSYGKGKAYYIGFEQSGDFQRDFIQGIIDKYCLTPPISAVFDDGICIRKREKENENFYFVINETDSDKKITFDKTYKDMLTGKTVSGSVVLGACDFYILTDIN